MTADVIYLPDRFIENEVRRVISDRLCGGDYESVGELFVVVKQEPILNIGYIRVRWRGQGVIRFFDLMLLSDSLDKFSDDPIARAVQILGERLGILERAA